MKQNFNYPVKLTKQKEGGYLVRFFDLPEAITQGETVEDALNEASDCLEEALAHRIAKKMDIPKPSSGKKCKYVSPSTIFAAKAALYVAMREQKLSNILMADKLNCDEKEVRRLLDPYYNSKLPRIEEALHVLGIALNIFFEIIKKNPSSNSLSIHKRITTHRNSKEKTT